MIKNTKPINILLVEDNPADVRLTKEALADTKLIINLAVVYDGVEAMEYLNGKGAFKDAIKPDLIILDLNLPRKDGREVLSEIKDTTELKDIPVVILTTSQAEEDIVKMYQLHANCFISKPVDLNQFLQVVKSIESFWFTIVSLPPNNNA